MCLCQIHRYMTHAPQLSSIYARALYASQMIAIYHRAAGGTLTAIMSYDK